MAVSEKAQGLVDAFSDAARAMDKISMSVYWENRRDNLLAYIADLETFATAARNLGKQNCPDWGPSCKGPGCSACAFNAALAKVAS